MPSNGVVLADEIVSSYHVVEGAAVVSIDAGAHSNLWKVEADHMKLARDQSQGGEQGGDITLAHTVDGSEGVAVGGADFNEAHEARVHVVDHLD